MFFDDETFKFKLKFIGKENINTKFETSIAWSLSLLFKREEFLKKRKV